jgi:serine kinase
MPRRKPGQDVGVDDKNAEFHMSRSEERILKQKGFSLSRKLNSGVSAEIYLSNYVKGDTDVSLACKVIDKKKANAKFLSKFLPREIAILSKLSNPHCVQIHSILDDKNKCFLFMRLAENGDLLEYLTEHGSPDESHSRMWMRQLLLALKYLHSKKIAHRDIKCENILITKNLNAKLGDFGFSRYWADSKGNEIYSSTFCGSMSYTAPEILTGSPYCPKNCDVWSLGVVFFIMLDMHKPFNKSNVKSLLRMQLNRQYSLSPKTEQRVSSEAKDFLKRMLEPIMQQRPTAETLLKHEWISNDKLLSRLVPDGEQKANSESPVQSRT